jgi:predicted transcriptional regulator
MRDIKKLRRNLGLTQHELSRMTRVPRWRICFFETDRINLTEAELDRIKLVLERRAREVVESIAAA